MKAASSRTTARASRKRAAPKAPPDNPLMLLRELPTAAEIFALKDRFPELDPDAALTFLTLLHVTGSVLNMAESRFSRAGISKGKFYVLMLLLRIDTSLRPSDLAERIGVTRATITGLLDGLERDGLVKRVPDPGDRRTTVIRITGRGETFLHGFLPGHFRRVRRLLSGLDRGERAELRRLLGKIRDATPAAREVE